MRIECRFFSQLSTLNLRLSLKRRHDAEVAVAEVRAAVSDAAMTVEFTLRIEQAIRIDVEIRPVRTGGVNCPQHGELELVIERIRGHLKVYEDALKRNGYDLPY